MLRSARRSPVLCVLVLVLVVLTTPLFAQTVTGTMTGNVTDASQSALPGVTITIRNVDMGL